MSYYGHYGYGRRDTDYSYSRDSRDDSYYRHRRDYYRDDWSRHRRDDWDYSRDSYRHHGEWRRRNRNGPGNPPKERRRHDSDECCQIF